MAKLLNDTMTKEDRQNLIAFFKDMSAHPEWIKYHQLLKDRYAVVAEQVMMSPQEKPYERGYSVGCLHSASFPEDFTSQTEAQWKQEAKDKAAEEDKESEEVATTEGLDEIDEVEL